MSGNYISNHIKAIKSWLQHNHVILPKEPKIHIKGRGKNRKYAGESPPSHKELQDLFEVSDFRQKVAIALIAFAGVRHRSIGNFNGTDGLRISDFPELHIDSQQRKKEGTIFVNMVTPFVFGATSVEAVCQPTSMPELLKMLNALPSWIRGQIHPNPVP